MRVLWPFTLLLLLIWAAGDAAPAVGKSPIQIITQMYQHYAGEAATDVRQPNGPNLLDSSSATLSRYFDSQLVALLLKDRECADRQQGICNLDFDPIWDSQDPAGTVVRQIAAGSHTGSVSVILQYPGNNGTAELDFDMVRTKGGWRIADVRSSHGWDLIAILSH